MKKITTGGTERLWDRLLCLANAVVDRPIEFEEADDGERTIGLNLILLATFDEHDYVITGGDEVVPMLPDTSPAYHPGGSRLDVIAF